MKRIVKTLVLSMIVLALVGCTSKANSVDVTKESNNNGNISDVPSDDKILSNMNESEIINVNVGNDSRKLKVTSIDIKKANKEEKSYNVHCTAKQSDEKYEYTADYVLHYNLYDRGGWILDKFDTENKKLNSLIAVPEEVLKETVSNEGYSNIEIVSIDKYEKNRTVYNSKVKAQVTYTYMTEISNISMQSTFDESGWQTKPISNESSEDWSPIYGTWLGTNTNKSNKEYINVNIQSIDTNKSTINYSYEYYTRNGYLSGSGIKLYTGNITSVLKKSIDSPYDYEMKFTHENCATVTIYIGKDNGMRAHASNVEDYTMTKK